MPFSTPVCVCVLVGWTLSRWAHSILFSQTHFSSELQVEGLFGWAVDLMALIKAQVSFSSRLLDSELKKERNNRLNTSSIYQASSEIHRVSMILNGALSHRGIVGLILTKQRWRESPRGDGDGLAVTVTAVVLVAYVKLKLCTIMP